MNIQGVQQADSHIRNSFSPLCNLADMVLCPRDNPIVSRFWTEQTVSLASPKCGSSSDAVLHSVNKTQKKILFPSIANQIPDKIYTCRINQDCELLIDVGVAERQSQDFCILPALLDSGANTTFIDTLVAEWLGFPLIPLTSPIRVFNVDGFRNSAVLRYSRAPIHFPGHMIPST